MIRRNKIQYAKIREEPGMTRTVALMLKRGRFSRKRRSILMRGRTKRGWVVTVLRLTTRRNNASSSPNIVILELMRKSGPRPAKKKSMKNRDRAIMLVKKRK